MRKRELYRICENPECKTFFSIEAIRSPRLYCSDKCRGRLWRVKNGISEPLIKLERLLTDEERYY